MRSVLSAVVAAIWLATPAAQGDGTREFTVTGCLLSNGYAAFQIENATIDAIDGKAIDRQARPGAPDRWLLDGGGNLRRYTGQTVQVVGRTAWRAASDGEPPATPHLEVASVKTVADSCK